jgi:hypothetical protein
MTRKWEQAEKTQNQSELIILMVSFLKKNDCRSYENAVFQPYVSMNAAESIS